MLGANNDKYLSIAELFNVLNNYQLNYAYNGDFTNDLTERILALAETNMEVEEVPVKIKKKVYVIIIESLQNITRSKESMRFSCAHDSLFPKRKKDK